MTSQVDQELHHLTSPKKLSRQWGALQGLKPIKFLLIKRNAFQHEREVRLAYYHPNSGANHDDDIKPFDIDPNALFDRLLFDPRINNVEFAELKARLEKSGYNNEIAKSTIYEHPDFDSISID